MRKVKLLILCQNGSNQSTVCLMASNLSAFQHFELIITDDQFTKAKIVSRSVNLIVLTRYKDFNQIFLFPIIHFSSRN